MKSTIAELQSCSVPVRVFVFSKCPYRLRPTQPSNQLLPVALTEGVKRLGREIQHSLVCRIEIKL